MECAPWARRVTPSVLASAARIEGDLSRIPGGPELLSRGDAMQCWGPGFAMLRTGLSLDPRPGENEMGWMESARMKKERDRGQAGI